MQSTVAWSHCMAVYAVMVPLEFILLDSFFTMTRVSVPAHRTVLTCVSSCAAPGGQTWRRPAHTGDTGTAGVQCASGSDV